MANFTNFFFGSNLGVWEEAIGEVFGTIEDQRQAVLAAIYLSTAAIGDLSDRYAVFTGGKIDPSWQLEVFREHLQETIQAFFMMGSTAQGISQAVAATTMIPPVMRDIRLLSRWILGFQYLPNRFFKHMDGFVCATVDGPYEITEDTNTLVIRVDGGSLQTIVLPTGEITEQEVIAGINEQLVGADASLFGKRFCIETQNNLVEGSIQVDSASTADTLFGFDNFVRNNAPAPSGLLGTQPFGWRIEAPFGSTSTPADINAAIFGTGSAVIKGTEDSPFAGLVSGALLSNGGFEEGFEQWDKELGPDFFISNSQARSGSQSLAVRTRQDFIDGIFVDVENTLKTAKKIAESGRTITLTGFHQATTQGSFLDSSAHVASSPVYTWLTSHAVFGYVHNQRSVDPVVPDPDAFTVKLRDTGIDFIEQGVQVGMAIHVDDGQFLFDGVIKGVQTHDLFVDFWRNGPDGTPKTPHVSDPGGFNALKGYNHKALVDFNKNFIALGVQTGPSFTTRDKIRVDVSQFEFGRILARQIVRNITDVSNSAIIVDNWGGSPTPFDNAPYAIYTRPANGTNYIIFNSLSEAPDEVGADTPAPSSAQFNYRMTYFDDKDNEIGFDETGFLQPTPSIAYTQFTLEKDTPNGTKFIQLSITVKPQANSPGALATIDDITWDADEGVFRELHVANDNRMQKIIFKDEGQLASGIVTYTNYPKDTDMVTVGSTTFEFDTGSRATGTLTYSGNPTDTETFQLGGSVFEFDDNCVFTAGRIQVFKGSTADETFTHLRDIIVALFGSAYDLVLDTTANTIKFTTKIYGPAGNSIQFQENSGAITLSPSTGFLAGGDDPSVTGSNVPIPIEVLQTSPAPDTIDVPYVTLTSEINSRVSEVRAEIRTDQNVITITAVQDGIAGNTIPFSATVNSPPAYSISPVGGFLSGGTTNIAGGIVSYSGQPADGDVIVIGSVGYEFDNNGSGICGNAIPVFIHPSGVGFTYSGLVAAVNARGEAIATLDSPNSKITLEATTPGVAGNSTPFRENSSVLTISPLGGDSTAQSATATNGTSRSYSAALVTYEATATAPTTDAVGTFQTISGVQSGTVTLTQTVPATNRVIVCVGTNSTTQDPTPPTCVDSKGQSYTLDASVTSGANGRVYVFSHLTGVELASGVDTVTVSVASGQTFNGVAISVLSVFGLCEKDETATNNSSGTSLTVGPTAALDVSGEYVLAAFSVLGPSSDSFTPGSPYSLIGRVGTIADANQVTINPQVKTLTSGTFGGAVETEFDDPDSPTCSEVAEYINERVSGITAFCEVVSGLFPNGRLGLRTHYSGINACLVVGHGSANRILGFTDDFGVCNDADFRRPAWEVAAGGSGVVTMIARAVPPAEKFFGTEWHLRFWAKAFHPSGISVSGLTVSGIKGYVSLRFDSGVLQTSVPIPITESPVVVELIDEDPGTRFDDVEARITFSGVTSGIRVVASEPYLINETSKSLHLDSNTIPRNKQREYKLNRLTVANPDSFTQIEAGLVGLIDFIDSEVFALADDTSYSDLANANIFPNSESVGTLGIKASGEIAYTGNPSDGDTVTLGEDVYEFDNNFSITVDRIQVIIGLTADDTFANFVEQVLSNSLTHEATQDTVRGVVTVSAKEPGVDGNSLLFVANSSVLMLDPLTSTLTGGVDPVAFKRGDDYVIRYDTGQIARTGSGAIPVPAPDDLAITYSYFPGGIGFSESYVQTIKPVGEKLEPEINEGFFFFGTHNDWQSVTGVIDNLTIVPRTPTRFSYLKPVERGLYSQVVTFSGVGFSAPLDFKAKDDQAALLIKDGVPVVNSSDGWQFSNDKTIVINADEFEAASVYEFQYFLKYQYTSPPITIPEPEKSYVLLPYSYKVRDANEIKEDVQKVLALDENRIGTLVIPAITDKTLSTLERTIGDTTEVISDEFYQYVDESTVEIFIGAFDESATYTLTYKSRRIEFVSPVNEQWEFSTGSGTNFGPYVPFIPGDKFKLDQVAKFRVTTWGDFDVDDYRVRAIAGIIDSPDISSCGFGVEPFGTMPFGGCGLATIEDPLIIKKSLSGRITLDGGVATFASAAASHAFVAIGPTNSFGAGNVRYVALAKGMGLEQSDPDVSTIRVPASITLSSLWIKTTDAIPANTTLTAKFYLNGVARDEITLTMVQADGTIKGANGVLVVAEDDTLTVQVTITGTGIGIQKMSAGYKVEV